MLAMESGGMVEENGGNSGTSAGDPLAHSPGELGQSVVTVTSVQSVIQPNQQQSVIQTPSNLGSVQLAKGNIILVQKPNSVIQTTAGSLQTLQVQTTGGNLQTLQVQTGSLQTIQVQGLKLEHPGHSGQLTCMVVGAASDDSLDEEEDDPDHQTKKRRDILTRRPSYRKILNDLGGAEIATNRGETTSDEDDSELSTHSISGQYQTVLPPGAIQISSQDGVQGLHTLTMTNATTAGGTIVQYAQGQDGQFFVPGEYVVTQGGGISGGPIIAEDQQRKREMRLLKNREAARECRRKKKEYIKCLENRVAVLENQNKALIDELKALKELYCQQKVE